MRTKYLTCVLAVGVAALQAACSGSGDNSIAANPPSSISAQSVQDEFHFMMFDFVDFETGESIPGPFNVSVYSDEGVYNDSNEAVHGSSFVHKGGPLRLKGRFNKGSRVSLVAGNRAVGLVETGVRVGPPEASLTDSPVKVRMVSLADQKIASLNNSSLGVTISKSVFAARSDGRLPALVLSTPDKFYSVDTVLNGSGQPLLRRMGETRVSIPDGTAPLGSNGAVLAVKGPLTASVVYFSPLQSESLEQFSWRLCARHPWHCACGQCKAR
ncbi:MAG: hypothetical protein HC848_07770 [Limnobacter sp.]|nr:hypothetical protein [Limnobacter sp.]